MYRNYFGLSERPFDLTTNPRFLFLSSGHREALSVLHYGMAGDKGITLLIGDAGTGKTTLARAALAHYQGSEVLGLYLSNPALTRQEFFEFIADGVGLGPTATRSKTTFLRELDALLAERRRAGKLTALVVDEAQAIPSEILEEIRMLANLESPTNKHLSILLAGQPELAARLNEPALRPLKQRIALRTTLTPFRLLETACYLAMRLRVAGGDPGAIFYRSAVERIYEVSRGIPRTINVVADNALLTAFALKVKPVTTDVVDEVCRDLDVTMGGSEVAAADARGMPPQAQAVAQDKQADQQAADRGRSSLLGTPARPEIHRADGDEAHEEEHRRSTAATTPRWAAVP